MGNHRFRLTDMVPNAWFYKLRDMGRTKNHTSPHSKTKKHTPTSSSSSKLNQPHLSHQRKSYYYTRDLTTPPSPNPTLHHHKVHNNSPRKLKPFHSHLIDPPRKSSKKRPSTTTTTRRNTASTRLVTSSVSAAAPPPDSTPEEYPNTPLHSSSDLEPPDFDSMVSWSTTCQCKTNNNVNVNIHNKSFTTKSDLELPPIITKNPPKFHNDIPEMNHTKPNKPNANEYTSNKISTLNQQRTNSIRRVSLSPTGGVRLRTNSPRIASRKAQANGRRSVSSYSSSRRSLSRSFAVVKSSSNPQKDFRESMVEMIVENNIRAPKDLEELLACYLSLNSDKYHDLIIKVFRQIWFDFSDIYLK